MNDTLQLIIAGFGGQGVLFAGKILVYAGMLEGNEVSWLPSYGPEMRGGTANINVIISSTPVGSPIITHPNMLVALNQPSLEKFEKTVAPGGTVFIDSSLVKIKVSRDDIQTFYIPAANIANKEGLKGLANMIMVGRIAKETGLCSLDTLVQSIRNNVSERKKNLVDLNIQAVKIGYESQN